MCCVFTSHRVVCHMLPVSLAGPCMGATSVFSGVCLCFETVAKNTDIFKRCGRRGRVLCVLYVKSNVCVWRGGGRGYV